MLTRRALLLTSASASFLGIYSVGVEPQLFPAVTRYSLQPTSWPANLRLKIAVIADLHACEPWMNVERIEQIVHATNMLGADVIVLLGDYVAGHAKITAVVPNKEWAHALAALRAPLGVYAILGNHDWWDDRAALARGHGPVAAKVALEQAGVPVLENKSIQLAKGREKFWLAGLGDQEAFAWRRLGRPGGKRGVDDLEATLNGVADDSPVVLLAHEPDIFPTVPERVSVTLAGHTHGGQVRVLGMAPFIPSPLSRVYSYGHFFDRGRHLIVSGGLGCSWWPVRLGVPPEVVLVEIGAESSLNTVQLPAPYDLRTVRGEVASSLTAVALRAGNPIH
ncbi:metallophosphoesterase [Rhodoblastus sp.]|uniref:metallophosphoesterase n=1 Tax=Rhodoblastus sp. TaxID=1962975 RepID=UPI003F9C33C2